MKYSRILKTLFSLLSALIVFNLSGQNDLPTSDHFPRFPGCEKNKTTKQEVENCAKEKLLLFVHSNINYPETAKTNKVGGTVIVQFVIEASGKVTNGRVVRDIKGHFELPVLSMIESMPDWIPGKKEGKATKMLYTLPILFEPNESKSLSGGFGDLGRSTNIVEEEIVKEFASNFEMTMEDGSKKKLSDFKGQVIYLSFWASWCGPCIKGFNKYRELRKEIEDMGIVLLNVSIDDDSEKWKAAIATHNPTGIHALVPHDEVRELYQIHRVPRYEIVGKNGQFIYLSDAADRDILENFKNFIEQ